MDDEEDVNSDIDKGWAWIVLLGAFLAFAVLSGKTRVTARETTESLKLAIPEKPGNQDKRTEWELMDDEEDVNSDIEPI